VTGLGDFIRPLWGFYSIRCSGAGFAAYAGNSNDCLRTRHIAAGGTHLARRKDFVFLRRMPHPCEFGFCKGGSFVFSFHRTDGTFPLSEKIIAATQSSHNAIENVRSVPRFRNSNLPSRLKRQAGFETMLGTISTCGHAGGIGTLALERQPCGELLSAWSANEHHLK
jgi:hypothetical protein